MNVLRRRSSRKGNKSLLQKVFSSKRKSPQFSCPPESIKNLGREESGPRDESKPKITTTLSSNSIPQLQEIDSFESTWTTRSDTSADEETATATPAEDPAEKIHTNVNLEIVSSPSFENELSIVLQETIKKLVELDPKVQNIDSEEKEEFLEIDCSEDSIVEEDLPTPPSSTNAIFSGDFCDYSFASESSDDSVASESTASPPPKPHTVPRTQDIFRPKTKQIESPVHHSGGDNEDQLQVKFTPSFEGIEMTKSFQQLETIEEEPSWYSPSTSFDIDGDKLKQASGSVTQGLKLTMLWVFLLYNVCDTGLPLEKVGDHLTELVIPALEAFVVQPPTDGPAVHKTFYNSHHTAMGAWLK